MAPLATSLFYVSTVVRGASPSDCGPGTVFDNVSSTCILAPATTTSNPCGVGTVRDSVSGKCVPAAASGGAGAPAASPAAPSSSSPSPPPSPSSSSTDSLVLSPTTPNEYKNMVWRMDTNGRGSSFGVPDPQTCFEKCQREGAAAAQWYDGFYGGPKNVCNCYSASCDDDCFDREGCDKDNEDWFKQDPHRKYWINPSLLSENLAACLDKPFQGTQ